jgi:hypothetical protein
MKALLAFLTLSLAATGCSDKSFALVSLLSRGGQFNDVGQIEVEVVNDPHHDKLAYPKERKDAPLYRFDETAPLTFSIGYKNSTHAGTLALKVTVLDRTGKRMGYGEGSATIIDDEITPVTVRITSGGSAACDPAAPTACAGGTCYVSCQPDDSAVGMCTMAGAKDHGQLCSANEECKPGLQCFEYGCGAGKPGVKACLRFCKDDSQCGGGRCSNRVPCGSKTTDFKTCSQPCNPVGEATQGCAAGLHCFVFPGEIADCDCSRSTGVDGTPCQTGTECAPGFTCVKMAGAMTCRPLCRLDAPSTCAAGKVCNMLIEPDFKTYGACW